jgi:MFS family permease
MVAVTILPLGALLFRRHPERFGLLPDGGTVGSAPPPAEVDFTVGEARRTGSFWLYLLANFAVAMLGTGLLFHNYDILGRNGLSRETATAAFAALGLLAAGANLFAGMLLDRLPYRLVLAVGLGLFTLALLLAGRAATPAAALVYGGAYGVSQGATMAISASVWAKHFGRRHLGSIKGTVQTVGVAGAALGPFWFAFGVDTFGGYGPVLLISTLLPLALIVAIPFVGPPVKPGAASR